MASRKNKTGITVAGILGGLAIVLIAIIVIIQTGVWATVAPQFGLPAITSISQILPGEDSMQKTNIGLGLKKPDLSKIEGQIKDGLASSGNTGEKDSTNTDMGASGLPASAASPMSVSEAITAARNLPTETPHTKGYNRAEDFGDWQNSDHLCGYGTTRDYILNRDLTNPVMDSNCKVQSGTLHDPYTGQTINFRKSVVKNGKTVSGDSTAVQIDHVVALNDAWASGLWKNSRKRSREIRKRSGRAACQPRGCQQCEKRGHQPVRERCPQEVRRTMGRIHPIRLAAEQQRLPVLLHGQARLHQRQVWTFHEQLGEKRDDRVPAAMPGERKLSHSEEN